MISDTKKSLFSFRIIPPHPADFVA
ncbi:uncharacterized protein METZ01_LOCUS127337 [marine metagenome]|uniref:Uncharacterized protein n=1 Tax=marine metagenome TaxID=408172 RepID=A0A381YD66_9ZZZZ